MNKGSKFLALFTAAVLLLSLAACGPKQGPTPVQDAEAFLALVDAIPEPVTATEETLSRLTAAEQAYAALSEEAKAVDGVAAAYDKLTAARAAYNEAKAAQDLAAAKAAAIERLNGYADEADYTVNLSKLKAAIAVGVAGINGALTPAEVDTALTNALAAIDAIKTDREENEDLASIVSIRVKTPPAKTGYTVGQTFDKTGMVIEATKSDGSKEDVTSYTCTPSGPLQLSDTEIVIQLDGRPEITARQEITVKDKEKLVTPSVNVFRVGASGSFEVDRDPAMLLGSLENLAALKIYVYESDTAAESIASFTITADATSITFKPDGAGQATTVTTATSSAYQYLKPGNYYLQRADVETFLVALLSDFDYGNTYYFESQFLAVAGSDNSDSLLSERVGGFRAAPVTVTFDSMGGSSVAAESVVRYTYAARPTPDPTKINNVFIDWFESGDGGVTLAEVAFDFAATPIADNITLYAKWEPTGGQEKEKLGVVDTAAGSGNFMGNGSSKGGNFTFNRGSTAVPAADFGTKVDHVLVRVYDGTDKTTAEELLRFKITGKALLITSLDGSIVHRASTATDNGYNGVSTTNAFIVGKYFSLFVNLIRAADGNEAIEVGTKLYFSFQLIAVADSDYLDGEESDVCINDASRTFTMKAQGGFDLGGMQAIVRFDSRGGTAAETAFVTVGSKIARPSSDPVRDGYVFAGWYADAACTQAFDFENTAVTTDMKTEDLGTITLYANWTVESEETI